VAYANGGGLARERLTEHGDEQSSRGDQPDRCGAWGLRARQAFADAQYSGRQGRDTKGQGAGAVVSSGWWVAEPDVGRVAHGIPNRVDRLRCLGNAVVPQIVELIGRAIIQFQEVET
jgi:DNA (cytosine-5)-methyltransferase 1